MNQDTKTFPFWRYLSPRFWPLWLSLGLFRITVMLPYRWQLRLGIWLGDLAYYLLPKRRHITKVNISLAYPELTTEQQHQLVRDAIRSTGMAAFETPLFWWGSEKRLKPLLHLEGMEHLQTAWSQGKGVIMLGGHFTCMLLAGRLLAMELPYQILVKPAKNPLFEAIMRHYRSRYYGGIIESSNLRGMVSALKKNKICWYSPDQDFGRKFTVFAPFMGVPTATLTMTARLAKLSGSPVVPINYERLPNGKGYSLRFLPALENYPSGDDVADAARINAVIEEQARHIPDQYLWVHRRFKTRPPGDPKVY